MVSKAGLFIVTTSLVLPLRLSCGAFRCYKALYRQTSVCIKEVCIASVQKDLHLFALAGFL